MNDAGAAENKTFSVVLTFLPASREGSTSTRTERRAARWRQAFDPFFSCLRNEYPFDLIYFHQIFLFPVSLERGFRNCVV